MNRERFEAQHAAAWKELESILTDLEAGRSTPAARSLPALYRRLCHHLALARARCYGAGLEERLNSLAVRGHHQLYRARGASRQRLARFLAYGFPRAVRREGRLVLLCCLLFFGSFAGMVGGVLARPDLAYEVLGSETAAEFEEMYDPEDRRARSTGDDFLMFGYYIFNNISIALRTFAGGIFAGIGALFTLLYNGVILGTVSGHLSRGPGAEVFWPFVIGHGAFELPAIVLAGVAGLKIGAAVVFPGRLRRGAALRRAADASLPLLYGTIFMLLAAAFLEAFWSSAPTAPAVRYAVGTLLWLGVAAYFLFAGRRGDTTAAPEP